jgi:hypothetical protein
MQKQAAPTWGDIYWYLSQLDGVGVAVTLNYFYFLDLTERHCLIKHFVATLDVDDFSTLKWRHLLVFDTTCPYCLHVKYSVDDQIFSQM